MSNKRRLMYCALAMVLLLLCVGIYSKCQRKPVIESVERDTVIVYDTVPHYYPKPVEVEKVRTEYKFLTRVQTVGKTDTLLQHDSVLVEVPITSKHYGCKDYDAWVSGFEPSLDSIKVYQRTEYITERVTISKPPNKWELDAMAGIDYNTASQRYTPYAGGELTFKPSRLQVGIRGGIIKNEKAEPFAGAVIRYRLF